MTENLKNEKENIATREAGLSRKLTRAQMTMIAIGSAVGTGLFLGSGFAISHGGGARCNFFLPNWCTYCIYSNDGTSRNDCGKIHFRSLW